MQIELDGLREQQRMRDIELRKKEVEVQRKKDALISSQTEMRRIEQDLQEFQNQ